MNGIKVTISPEAQRLAYPKNTDVRNVRPSLVDRIDLFMLAFPGESAFYAGCAALTFVSVANLFMR